MDSFRWRYSVSSLDSSSKESCRSNRMDDVSSFLGKNWFDTYSSIQQDIELFDEDVHCDILQNLFSERINKDQASHLLYLLEHYHNFFQDSNRLEQTVGTLINIFGTNPSVEIRSKILITCTTLLCTNLQLVENYPCLRDLMIQLFYLLIRTSKTNVLDTLSLIADECLLQFEECSPGILEEYHLAPQISPNNILTNALLVRNGCIADFGSIKSWLVSLPSYSTNPHQLHRILYFIFEMKKTGVRPDISPLVFAKFKKVFAYSSQIYNFHFNLLLLQSFGLELFSTSEESFLLNRLVCLSSSPFVPILSRLFILEFAIPLLNTYVNCHVLRSGICLSPFDGPDTQEKKLMIMNHLNVRNEELLRGLATLEESSLTNNTRATNSLYRLFYHFLQKRPSMTEKIENIIISMVFAAPEQHITRSFELIKVIPSLSEKVCTLFVDKLLRLYKYESPISIIPYLSGVPLILEYAHTLEEDCLIQLLECVIQSFRDDRTLAKTLLNSCGAVIRYTQITRRLKSLLNRTLEELFSYKISVTISSWAQIYMIAINTLSNRENIQRVFQEEEYGDPNNVVLVENPIRVLKSKCEPNLSDGSLTLAIRLYLDANFEPDCIFCLRAFIICEKQGIREELSLPFLSKSATVEVKLKPRKPKPFTLDIAFLFGKKSGKLHRTNYAQLDVKFSDLIAEQDPNLSKLPEAKHETIFKLSNLDFPICKLSCVTILPDSVGYLSVDPNTNCVRLRTNNILLFKQFYNYFNVGQ